MLGAIVGEVAGAAAEEAYTPENGIEHAIKLEYRGYISVVQAVSKDINIKAGNKVRIIDNDGVTCVVPF